MLWLGVWGRFGAGGLVEHEVNGKFTPGMDRRAFEWSEKWQMKFKIEKCSARQVS